MTSATKELRRMLDERGVEWTDRAEDLELTLAGFADTRWDANGFRWCYIENGGTATLASCRPMEIKGCTPEQAIASTLWSGVERSKTEYATLTAEQAIAVTLGRQKAKAHPYGYEPDTGAFDTTRCECGCLNDISATYCNDCGGEIEVDMDAEKEIYRIPRNSVFAEKHDDGSLEFCERRYVPEDAATLGSEPPYDELLRCLENDWHISASWDGLRKFWCIELTEEGLKLRDATHGTLTAEQVHDAIFNGSSYASYDGAKYYADGIGMQAIADELNAELGSGTCRNKATSLRTFWCDCCDCALEDWMDVGGKLVNGLRYCPNCGAKVENERTPNG